MSATGQRTSGDAPPTAGAEVRPDGAVHPEGEVHPEAVVDPDRLTGGGEESAWRRMRLWGVAHAVDDLYQGLVPASVPYFVLDRHYSYVAAAGLTLAATLGSSVPQPFLGVLVDRVRWGWLAGAGIAVAGIGLGLSGLFHPYPLVWTLILVSGLGVAMFHPAAGKSAREAAGDSAGAMSIFAAGGSVGFFLAPVLATPALVAWGVGATALFIPPAVLVAFLLYRNRHRHRALAASRAPRTGTDRWRPFLVLTSIEVVRSTVFFGINTFVELYWIRHLHASRLLAGTALAVFLGGGVLGTLLGGRIADRIGLVRTVQLGAVLTIPALAGLRFLPGSAAATPLLFAILAGVALNIPFAVLVKLGQDYLPNRPGTAAGVTLGLAVSVGGLIAPVFGVLADSAGPQGVFAVLCLVPLVAIVLGLFLTEPEQDAVLQ
jgi:MFS transporter, FSR family, fosmidomycin resistance protein